MLSSDEACRLRRARTKKDSVAGNVMRQIAEVFPCRGKIIAAKTEARTEFQMIFLRAWVGGLWSRGGKDEMLGEESRIACH